VDEMKSVVDLCGELEIELRGDDGQPFCCGERMQTKAGLIGTDYAKCHVCGKAIGNAGSPHINGGYVLPEEWFAEHGNKTWVRLDVDPKTDGN